MLFGDEAMVQQLASNVIENAIKYSGKGSEIRIACGTSADAGFLEISDNGPGLAPEERNGLFRRLERGKTVGQTPGTGLGLYIVKRYANWLGMTITVYGNEPGLRLRFDFPIAGKT
jgi:two-component system sensor histidine kinase TctE